MGRSFYLDIGGLALAVFYFSDISVSKFAKNADNGHGFCDIGYRGIQYRCFFRKWLPFPEIWMRFCLVRHGGQLLLHVGQLLLHSN